MQRSLPIFFVLILFFLNARAQNPLPDFSVEDLGKNKVRISWLNPFGEDCIQLTVQSSTDSVKGFRTIFSTESPQLPQNGFIYTLPFNATFYYRIAYILNGNAFYFSVAKSPIPPGLTQGPEKLLEKNEASRIITIRRNDSVIATIPYGHYEAFKDSLNRHTKDTLYILSQDEVMIKPYNPSNTYRPSQYVVNSPDGFIEIKIPDVASKVYKIIFFDTNGKKVFSINHITDTDMVIDKSDFLHAGWFSFELYENGNLKERNRILLQKDF